MQRCQKVQKVVFYAILVDFVTFGPLSQLSGDSGLNNVVFCPELHIYSRILVSETVYQGSLI